MTDLDHPAARTPRGWFARAFQYIPRRGFSANWARLKTLGLRGSLRRCREVVSTAAGLWLADCFDRRLGIDTSGQIPVSELLPSSEARARAYGFGSIPIISLRRALHNLRLDLGRYVFIDVGCGNGRALFIAAEFPFRHLLGIEHADALVDVVRRNIEVVRPALSDSKGRMPVCGCRAVANRRKVGCAFSMSYE